MIAAGFGLAGGGRQVHGLTATATFSPIASERQAVGSLPRTAQGTLVGGHGNSAFFIQWIRFRGHINGSIMVERVSPGAQTDLVPGVQLNSTGTSFVGQLSGQRLSLYLNARIFGANSLTGQVRGDDLVLTSPGGLDGAVKFKPGTLTAFNAMIGHLTALTRTEQQSG